MKFIKNTIISLLLMVSFVQPAFCSEINTPGAKDSIFEHLNNWDSTFKIDYYNKDAIDVIREKAKADDYLYVSLIGLVYRSNGRNAEVEAKYRTTKEQETYIQTEVNNIIQTIIKDNMSDYDKVYAINQYLVNRFSYDNTLVNNNAYLALINNTTTCQGYAMTAYKLFKAAGIETRIVLGQLNGINHGWNLVKINGMWYQIDVTNNDYVGENRYFLRSDSFFRSQGFTWEADDYEQAIYDYTAVK